MGFYIQGPVHGKASYLAIKHGAMPTWKPKSFEAVPEGMTAICVVDNGPFEAAGCCFTAREFNAFTNPDDHRPKMWVLLDTATAMKLSDYPQPDKLEE